MGCHREPAHALSHPLHQQSHPTRVVAGVRTFRRTSAHKRSPLFRRWAPARSTIEPEGSPCPSMTRSRETLQERCRFRDHTAARCGSEEKDLRSPGDTIGPGDACRRRRLKTCLGYPVGRGGARPRLETPPWTDVFRRLCVLTAICRTMRASLRKPRSPRCPCSRDNASMTRRGRSCRCAAGSVNHRAGRRDLREPGQ